MTVTLVAIHVFIFRITGVLFYPGRTSIIIGNLEILETFKDLDVVVMFEDLDVVEIFERSHVMRCLRILRILRNRMKTSGEATSLGKFSAFLFILFGYKTRVLLKWLCCKTRIVKKKRGHTVKGVCNNRVDLERRRKNVH